MEQAKKRPDVQLISMIALALLFIAVLLFAIIYSSRKDKTPDQTEKETVSFPAISQTDTVDHNFFPEYSTHSAYEEYENDGIELIFSSVSYPKLEKGCGDHVEKINADILAVVNEHLIIKEHQRILALEKYERSLSSAEAFVPNEFILDLRSVTVKGKYLSILFTYTKTVSVSEPSVENVSLLFDLTTGESADLSDLLCLDASSAVDYVKNIISQDIKINPEMYYSNALEQLEYVIDLNDIYLTEDEVIVFFPSEVLTPSVFGIRTFSIPYDKIGY